MGFLISKLSNLLCIALLCMMPYYGYVQTSRSIKYDDPYTINVAGSNQILSQLCLDWSLGEVPMIQTLQLIPHFLFSTGYLQNYSDPKLIYQFLDSFALQIKIGPNPFSNQIQVATNQDGLTILSIRLIGLQGEILYEMNEKHSGIHFLHQIQIKKLNNPYCYVVIRFAIANTIYKIKHFTLIQE